MKKRPKIPTGDGGSTTFGPGVSANGSVVTGFSVDDHGILSTLQQNQNMNGNLSLKIISVIRYTSLALVHQTSCCLLYHHCLLYHCCE